MINIDNSRSINNITIEDNRVINNNINNCGKNFRTPPYPPSQGGLEGLNSKGLNGIYSNGLKRIYSRALKVSAFSLIELSIVLIIIGLLVAGVTGGKSLVESTKIRAFVNELEGWKRDVYTFKTARDRYPGDMDNLGKFGYNSGYTYSKTDFDEPYKSGTFTPDEISAPYVEIYTEGISNFKPLGNEAGNAGTNTGAPLSNAFKELSCKYYYKNTKGTSTTSYFAGFNGNEMLIRCNHYLGLVDKFNSKILKNLDLKIDDGKHNGGIIRSYCTNPDHNYEDGVNCRVMYYDMRLN